MAGLQWIRGATVQATTIVSRASPSHETTRLSGGGMELNRVSGGPTDPTLLGWPMGCD